jgi:photosystem II stability/assembly factor-like uncharacterized protein
VRFILTVLATGNATNDRALWGSPHIERAAGPVPTSASVTPTASATATSTPAPNQDWLLYTNSRYGFQFSYPSQAQIVDQTDSSLKMNLPFAPGTNLREKYLQTTVRENVNPCQSPLAESGTPGAPENVVINGISFLKQTAGDGGVGHLREWVAYSTLKNNACISMEFVLHSLHPGNFATPPPIFDKAAESAVFTQMMATFGWEAATLTPLPPTVEPRVVPSPNIRKLFMMDPSNGWAIGNTYVLRTGDGGATWYNMTMPGVSSVLSAFFQDSNRGWVLTPEGLYRTVESGIRWSHTDVPFTGGYIQFLDDRNGFVLSGEPSGMQKHAVSLYQTSDGGATWTLKYANDPSLPNNTLPFSGHKLGMAFRDTSTGWVGGDYPTPGYVYLYKTTDSGATWAQQSLSLPAGYESAYITIESPRFFGPNDAVLPVWLSTDVRRDLFIYESYNGGVTWTRTAGSVLQGRNIDFISVRHGFAWDSNGFFHTTQSAGWSWSQTQPNVNFGDDVLALDFVSETTGWIAQNAVNGSTPLYRTTNNGNTWSLISGPASPVTPPGQVLPDLVVTQMRIELQNAGCLMPGDPMGIRVWIKNNGQIAAGQFDVKVNTMNYMVTGLGAGETTSIFLPGYSNPVTATVDSINIVIESDEGNNSRSETLPVPTPPLPCVTPTNAPTQTPTPAPVTLTGPYAVVGVAPSDVLNIRSGAGIGNPPIDSFAPNAVNVMRTGPTASADNATWVEVQNPVGGTGWVNSYYLTEYVSHETFCADGRIASLIEQLKGAVNQSNGALLGSLVSPTHGLNLNYWASSETVHYSSAAAQSVFTDPQVITWGSGGGSGKVDTGTFAQVVQPEMIDVLNSAYQLNCDALSYGQSYTDVSRYAATPIRFYSVVKPPTTDLDWKVWLVRIEYVNGKPYVFGAVHYVWEP